MRMIDTALHEHGNGIDLYREGYRDRADRIIEEIYTPINNGVYRAGFASSQAAYNAAIAELLEELKRCEAVLEDRRYLTGDCLTEADVTIFATLVRFDHVYHTNFQCNRRAIHEYHNLWNSTKELAQIQAIERTTNLSHIVNHYYTIDDVNPKQVVAVGPDIDFHVEHDRDRLPGGPPAALSN